MSDFFGPFLDMLCRAPQLGGSEFELGLSLFSLAVNLKARRIIEIGRFTGFSTLALAGALKFIDEGWPVPEAQKQRPDVDYQALLSPGPRKLFSVDPLPRPEAVQRIDAAGLTHYVEYVNRFSGEVGFNFKADLLFIDGDHSYAGCKADVMRFVPDNLRVGGIFVLHDYFGWYDERKQNNSPIKKVADELVAAGVFEHLLMDTGFMSFIVFRKTSDVHFVKA